MNTQIVTRFAPSPTGNLHIGGLRTALYAYALARQNQGTFILRIEDTDQKREVEGSAEGIEKMMKTFGLEWDALYKQSDRARAGEYRKAAEKLVAEGHAFYCQCGPRNAKVEGYSKELRDPCRDKGLTSGAIKLRVPDNEEVTYYDFVFKKEITWNTSDVADAVLLKSDGEFATYHLALAVDDNYMGVTHIFRGYDWLPSTPIHILVFKYLGFTLPQLGHLTDIQEVGGGKLSKRKGSYSCQALVEEEGYLPEALLNFVSLLGWAPKDNKEMFTLTEFVEVFNLEGLQKSNPAYNKEKLDWFNREYIKLLSTEEKEVYVKKALSEMVIGDSLLKKLTPIILERASSFNEIKKMKEDGELDYYINRPMVDLEKVSWKGEGTDKAKVHLEKALELMRSISLSEWNAAHIKETVWPYAEEVGRGNVLWPIRFTLSGKDKSPDPFILSEILGKDETIARLEALCKEL
jgi:glutamyl-tRNA synthetase